MNRRFMLLTEFTTPEEDYAYIILEVDEEHVFQTKLRHLMFNRVKKMDGNLSEIRFSSSMDIKIYLGSPEMNIREKNEDGSDSDGWLWADDFLGGEVWKELKEEENIQGEPADVDFEEIAFTDDGIRFYIVEGDAMLVSNILPYRSLGDV